MIKKPKIEEYFIESDPYIQCLLNARQIFYTHRGSFYPDKDFGSQMASLRSPLIPYALAYAAQALSASDGFTIKTAEAQGNNLMLEVCVNGKEGWVNYRFD